MDRVKRVSKLAKLDEFIENDLKGDYHSVVGERGGKLLACSTRLAACARGRSRVHGVFVKSVCTVRSRRREED